MSPHTLMGTVARTVGVGLGFTLLGALVVRTVMARRITRPLMEMEQSVRRFTEGELTTRVSVTTQDEIGQLGYHLNRMAARLQTKIQELETRHSQIDGILQSMTEGVIVVGPNSELLLVNEAARRIFGIGREVAAGRPFSEAVRHPELQALVREILKSGRSRSEEFVVYAPSERYLQVHATTTSSRGDGGPRALVVLHDITDLKHLEDIRRDFVANVSHELKTPLTAIRGAVETLLDGALNDPQNNRLFITSIAEETTRLHRLVDDLLALARAESKQTVLHREPIELKPFLEAEVSRYQALANAHQVSIGLEIRGSTHTLFADSDQLAQAIGNLLDNAIKYNQPGGRVIVRLSEENGQLRVEVEDTGIGIPSEDVPRIFERFYRVDKGRSRETGGTGLGLSIVKHITEAHGGSVKVQSRLNHGSCFTLLFPIA